MRARIPTADVHWPGGEVVWWAIVPGVGLAWAVVTLVVFSVAAAAFAAGGLVFDGRMDDGGELRDALVPFAVLLTGAAGRGHMPARLHA
jgi:hypothetical protein